MENQENISTPNEHNNPPIISKPPNNYWLTFFEFLKIAALAIIIVVPVRYFLFQPFIVKGESMAPNFDSGDYLIVDEISYKFSDPKRGDVVVFKYPKDPTQDFIKRVIGLPGETVIISSGKINIEKDGTLTELKENYLPQDLSTFGNVDVTLKEDEYFVLGDNRDHSYDSRIWGLLNKNNIIGKPVLRLFPLPSLSIIQTPSY